MHGLALKASRPLLIFRFNTTGSNVFQVCRSNDWVGYFSKEHIYTDKVFGVDCERCLCKK